MLEKVLASGQKLLTKPRLKVQETPRASWAFFMLARQPGLSLLLTLFLLSPSFAQSTRNFTIISHVKIERVLEKMEFKNLNEFDTLCSQVCGLFGFPDDLKLTLEIYGSRGEFKQNRIIARIYESYPNATLPAIYYLPTDIIYICIEDLNRGVFVHELAHALWIKFFAFETPEKLLEFLAKYAEKEITGGMQ